MPSSHTLNVSLTGELSEFIAEQVKSGRFRTASEVVRAGLRLLEREVATQEPSAGTNFRRDSLYKAEASKPATGARDSRS